MFSERARQLAEQHLNTGHAIQTGVKFELERDPASGTPKHLRTGLNVAMCDHAALVGLLVQKGWLTHEEYLEAAVGGLEEEVERYEERLARIYGVRITLR